MQTSLFYHITAVCGYKAGNPRVVSKEEKSEKVCGKKWLSRLARAGRSAAKLARRGTVSRKCLIVPIVRIDSHLTCPHCRSDKLKAYKGEKRRIQCEPMGRMRTYLEVEVRRFYCLHCKKTHYEHLPFLTNPKSRITRQLERTIVELRSVMSISAIAEYFQLPWETVRDAEKRALAIKYRSVSLKDVRFIGIDELYVFSREKSRRKYITVVRDMQTGAVLNVSRGKGEDALKEFAYRIRRWGSRIECVCMDMSNAFKNFVEHSLPDAAVVFDHFHVIKAMNDRLDKVRRRTCAAIRTRSERTLASETALKREKRLAAKALERIKAAKGGRFAALGNIEDVTRTAKGRKALAGLLAIDEDFARCHALKEDLRAIYSVAKTKAEAADLLLRWIAMARESKVREMDSMAATLEDNLEGVLGFWSFKGATNAATEGFNNKIRWLIKQAYGYRGYRYFRLKIFDLPNTRLRTADV